MMTAAAAANEVSSKRGETEWDRNHRARLVDGDSSKSAAAARQQQHEPNNEFAPTAIASATPSKKGKPLAFGASQVPHAFFKNHNSGKEKRQITTQKEQQEELPSRVEFYNDDVKMRFGHGRKKVFHVDTESDGARNRWMRDRDALWRTKSPEC